MLNKLKLIIKANYAGYFVTVFSVIAGGFLISLMNGWKINFELVYSLFIIAFGGVLFLAVLIAMILFVGGEK